MDGHVRFLAAVSIVGGLLGFLIAILVLRFLGPLWALQFAGQGPSGLLPMIGALGVTFFPIVLGLPSVVAGFGLLRLKQWSRTLTTVISAVNLLNIPVGTIVGVYGLWVMLSEETDPLFVEAPEDR